MEKAEFETAVCEAIDASPNNGAKWAPLTKLFAEEGIFAGGAISNQQAEQRTRIRQLLTRRKFEGQVQYFRFAVFVLNHDQATRHLDDPNKVFGSVVEMFELERPALASEVCLGSVLILRHDGGHTFEPLAVLSWGDTSMAQQMLSWYPGAQKVEIPVDVAGGAGVSSEDSTATEVPAKAGENVIFFGPPGTGKSYRIKEETADFFDVILTAFHPEYSYSDLIGAYKPVCGSDTESEITDYTGQGVIARPVIYYDFEPGVLIKAIVRAHEAEGGLVALVIDELNRGDCAAIFGDFMHLLDRVDSGRSEYGLDIGSSLGVYLVKAGVLESPSEKLYLPANLHILATMNTSDQALYPIDSAFKRRWSWEAIAIENHPDLQAVIIPSAGGNDDINWLEFINDLNESILSYTENEDKRIGPWFISAKNGKIPLHEIRNKLLYYLWHDVFRGFTGEVFMPKLRTFEAVQSAFDVGGIPAVLIPFSNPEVVKEELSGAISTLDAEVEGTVSAGASPDKEAD